MKIVNEKHHVVKSSWDLQEYSIFDSYKLSPYVVIFPQNDKEELWYNMLTGELLLLEKDEINDTDIYIRLIKHWYYINIKFDPKTIADIVYQFVKKSLENNKSSKPDKYIVTSTYACNARCFYCYENTLKQKSMTDEMALEIAKYLVKKAQDKDNKINIGWFGGEPLCGANAIRIIVKHLVENNIQFKSSMITNGYLINEFPIKEIKREWNLISCQITLDGTKENYQKIKNFKNEDENAYEKVLSNIETLLENGVFVNIRLNVGKDNAEDLFKLTKYLVERFKEYGRLLCIYTSPLFEGIESNFMIMEVPDSIYVHEYCKKIEDFVREHNMYIYKNTKFNYTIGHCMADSDKPVVITVDGNLTPCEHYFEQYICGNIWDGVTNTEPLEMFKEKNKNMAECATCFYYPKCMRLKHCPTEYICSEPHREFIKYQLKNVVEYEYKQYLEKENKRLKGENLC